MALERTPLDLAAFSDAAKKILSGPGPLKLMAARGLAPIPKPAEVLSVLYQLTLDADGAVKQAADKTAGELPDRILLPAVSDPGLDGRVLDFIASRVLGKPEVLQALILNQGTPDETIRDLAGKVGEKEIDLISGNEQRLLRDPRIIGAMYMNTRARMSTVDRAVELAVRNQVQVPGIPAWESVVQAVLGEQKTKEQAAVEDAAFAQAVAGGVDETAEVSSAAEALLAETADEDTVMKARTKAQIDQLSLPGRLRLATLGNSFHRSILIRDSNKMVAVAVIKSKRVSDDEVTRYAANRSLADDVIREIAHAKEWTRIYQVKKSLVNNPKCPLPVAMKLLPLLYERDLKAVSMSRGVPSALVSQAKKLVTAKLQGRGGAK